MRTIDRLWMGIVVWSCVAIIGCTPGMPVRGWRPIAPCQLGATWRCEAHGAVTGPPQATPDTSVCLEQRHAMFNINARRNANDQVELPHCAKVAHGKVESDPRMAVPESPCQRERHATFDRARAERDPNARLAILRDLPDCSARDANTETIEHGEVLVTLKAGTLAIDLFQTRVEGDRLVGKAHHIWSCPVDPAISMNEISGRSPSELATWARWREEPIDEPWIALDLAAIGHVRAISTITTPSEPLGRLARAWVLGSIVVLLAVVVSYWVVSNIGIGKICIAGDC